MPSGTHPSGVDPFGLLYLVVLLALMFGPVLFGRRSSPPDSDPGSDDGPGRGPRRSPTAPSSPPGGLPLPDADQSRTRLRDHRRLVDLAPFRRRRAPHRRRHEPDRTAPLP